MAHIYSTPEEHPEPEFEDYMDSLDGYMAAVKQHRERLAAWCHEQQANADKDDPLIGGTFHFSVADGRAEYMVYEIIPDVALIHLDYFGGYHADPILERGIELEDVIRLVRQQEKISELFGGRS